MTGGVDLGATVPKYLRTRGSNSSGSKSPVMLISTFSGCSMSMTALRMPSRDRAWISSGVGSLKRLHQQHNHSFTHAYNRLFVVLFISSFIASFVTFVQSSIHASIC